MKLHLPKLLLAAVVAVAAINGESQALTVTKSSTFFDTKSLDKDFTFTLSNGATITYTASNGYMTGYDAGEGMTLTLDLGWTTADKLIYTDASKNESTGVVSTTNNSFGFYAQADGTLKGLWQSGVWNNANNNAVSFSSGETADVNVKLNKYTGTSLSYNGDTPYNQGGLKSSSANTTRLYLNSSLITSVTLENYTASTYSYSNKDNTWNATYNYGKSYNVTDGTTEVKGGSSPQILGQNVASDAAIVVGGAGTLFLQTWRSGNVNLSNTFYLGDSTNTGTQGGSLHFGNDDDSNPRNTTTLSGKIYLVENATLKARGTNTINITGTVTDKNVPGSTDADGGYKLTLAGKGYNFTETSNVNVTTLEFAAAQTIHNANTTTSATFKNGFSADNLIMNVGNEITSEKAISGLTSLEVLGNGNAALSADLNLTSLSTLKLDATLNLGGNALTLGNAITFSGGKLAALQEIDDLATIFTGVSIFNGVTSSAETVIFDASKYFTNLPTENQYVLTYTDGDVAIKLIPEPTTATLSLLALAGLAARRRRR